MYAGVVCVVVVLEGVVVSRVVGVADGVLGEVLLDNVGVV